MIEYVFTTHGKLIKTFSLYKAIGYNPKNYDQWLKKHMKPRCTFNIDYFVDEEEHIVFGLQNKIQRYLVTPEIAEGFCLMSGTDKALNLRHYIQGTKNFSQKTSMPTHRIAQFRISKSIPFIFMKPLHDRVIIIPKEKESQTKSGLFIPDNAAEKPQEGTVCAVGDGTSEIKMVVSIGDNVLFSKHAGMPITFEGKDYLILRQSEILIVK